MVVWALCHGCRFVCQQRVLNTFPEDISWPWLSPLQGWGSIVCKGVSAPFLRHPPLDPAGPLFKIFVSPPLFSVPPLFKVFQTVTPPSWNPLLPSSDTPTFLTHNSFKQILKAWFYQFSCRFLSKINFLFFKSLYKYISLS